MDRLNLVEMFFHFSVLWFLAIGGPSAIFPDIHRYMVESRQLLTNSEFVELYTLAQVAPGPNAMYVTLIGWHLAGWKGVFATTIPFSFPRQRSRCSSVTSTNATPATGLAASCAAP